MGVGGCLQVVKSSESAGVLSSLRWTWRTGDPEDGGRSQSLGSLFESNEGKVTYSLNREKS